MAGALCKHFSTPQFQDTQTLFYNIEIGLCQWFYILHLLHQQLVRSNAVYYTRYGIFSCMITVNNMARGTDEVVWTIRTQTSDTEQTSNTGYPICGS
jgi:hypothetical protein